jgi:hypothetical protein
MPQTSLTGTIAISNSKSCLISLRSIKLFKFWYFGIHRTTQPTQCYDSSAHTPRSSLKNSHSPKIQTEINWKINQRKSRTNDIPFLEKSCRLGTQEIPRLLWNQKVYCWSQWPRGLRHELPSLARTLGSWVRIILKAWCLCAFILYLCCSVCR